MANKMLIDATHAEETRVAVVRGNRVEEFDFESASRRQLRGNIYLAKVTRVEPSLQAAFVDYGGNRHGFLAFGEIHPDYYQIPVADRQRLIEEEARLAEERANSDEKSERGGPGGRRPRRGRRTTRSGEGRQNKRLSAENEGEENIQASSEQEAEENQDFNENEVAGNLISVMNDENDGGSGESGNTSSDENNENVSDETSSDADNNETTENDNGDDNDDDENDSAEDSVEAVGGSADTTEEMPRAQRVAPRRYKIQEVIKRRQVILVQVVKEERGNKGAALTTYLSLAGRYSVLMPNTARGGGISRKITNGADRARLKEITEELEVPEGMGMIVRTAGLARTKIEIKRDFEYLMRLWENVAELTLESQAPALVYEEGSLIKRAIRDLYNKDIDEVIVAGETAHGEAKAFMKMLMPSHAKNVIEYNDKIPLFSKFGVESQLDQMFQNQVQLRSGGYIVINQTEALVAIDVNSGRSTREHNIEDTALRTNLEAAEEIARQLRLRDLAGLVVIDFIDMEEHRNNRSVERKMKDCLRHDRARIQVGRISHFGLLEMSRQRLRASVFESTTEICNQCSGTGHLRSPSSSALQILRIIEERLLQDKIPNNLIIRARAAVALYVLNQKRAHLGELEQRFGVSIQIEADDHLPVGAPFLVERGHGATATRPAKQAGVRVDSVDVSDMENDEEKQPDAEESARETRVHNENEDGERPRRRRRRGGRGRNRNSEEAGERSERRPRFNESASRDGIEAENQGTVPANEDDKESMAQPASSRPERPERQERSRPRRTPRRKQRTPGEEQNERNGGIATDEQATEISPRTVKEKAEDKDDDAPRPMPKIPELPQEESLASKSSGKGWWSKKILG